MTDIIKMRDKFWQEADSYATQYNLQGRHNGEYDAFRHAYVSGRFVQNGYEVSAQVLGIANEIFSKNELLEREMDLWNNAKGRDYAKEFKTPQELANKIYQAIKNQELITNIGNRPKANPSKQYDIQQPPLSPEQKKNNGFLLKSSNHLDNEAPTKIAQWKLTPLNIEQSDSRYTQVKQHIENILNDKFSILDENNQHKLIVDFIEKKNQQHIEQAKLNIPKYINEETQQNNTSRTV
jgi:hypothetical protein